MALCRILLIAASSAFCLALVLVVLLLSQGQSQETLEARALRDPSIRTEVVAKLATDNGGFYDSHVDSDLGRIVVASMEGVWAGRMVSTNRFGMRERDYEMPKPPGLVRIVLLGDSFVFGSGIAADDRMGVSLEAELLRRSPYGGGIEVLHLGVPSWNFANQEAFLRRQLSSLSPDVVLHLSLPNDIEDGVGVRGVGVASRSSPQLPERADSILHAGFPVSDLGFRLPGYVRHGIDFEGRERYHDSVVRLSRLSESIQSVGGRYRLIIHYRSLIRAGWQYLGRKLPGSTTHYVSQEFGTDKSLWIAKDDPHWNPEGNRRMALALYELLRHDDLAPRLELPAWDEATAEFAKIFGGGRREVDQGELTERELLELLRAPEIASSLDFRSLDDATAAQIHTGLDRHRMTSPYASFVLANPLRGEGRGLELRIQGRALPRPEMSGTGVVIQVEHIEVEHLTLNGQLVDIAAPVPEELLDRPFLNIRLVSDDYVYSGLDHQHCIVMELDSISLRPTARIQAKLEPFDGSTDRSDTR